MIRDNLLTYFGKPAFTIKIIRGKKYIKTEDGVEVLRLKKGKYKILETGEIFTSKSVKAL